MICDPPHVCWVPKARVRISRLLLWQGIKTCRKWTVHRSKLSLAPLRGASICLHRAYELRNHVQCPHIDALTHELSLPYQRSVCSAVETFWPVCKPSDVATGIEVATANRRESTAHIRAPSQVTHSRQHKSLGHGTSSRRSIALPVTVLASALKSIVKLSSP